jgi:hypothetical protein
MQSNERFQHDNSCWVRQTINVKGRDFEGFHFPLRGLWGFGYGGVSIGFVFQWYGSSGSVPCPF